MLTSFFATLTIYGSIFLVSQLLYMKERVTQKS
jgi:hypothetical protein